MTYLTTERKFLIGDAVSCSFVFLRFGEGVSALSVRRFDFHWSKLNFFGEAIALKCRQQTDLKR